MHHDDLAQLSDEELRRLSQETLAACTAEAIALHIALYEERVRRIRESMKRDALLRA